MTCLIVADQEALFTDRQFVESVLFASTTPTAIESPNRGPGRSCRPHEIGELAAELIMVFVIEARHRCLIDRPIHSLNLAVRPGMLFVSR